MTKARGSASCPRRRRTSSLLSWVTDPTYAHSRRERATTNPAGVTRTVAVKASIRPMTMATATARLTRTISPGRNTATAITKVEARTATTTHHRIGGLKRSAYVTASEYPPPVRSVRPAGTYEQPRIGLSVRRLHERQDPREGIPGNRGCPHDIHRTVRRPETLAGGHGRHPARPPRS